MNTNKEYKKKVNNISYIKREIQKEQDRRLGRNQIKIRKKMRRMRD